MNCIINKAVYNYYVQQNGRVSKKQNQFQILKSLERDSYLLTSKGIEEKAKLTLDFIRIKTQEYDRLKQEVEGLKQEAKSMGKDLL